MRTIYEPASPTLLSKPMPTRIEPRSEPHKRYMPVIRELIECARAFERQEELFVRRRGGLEIEQGADVAAHDSLPPRRSYRRRETRHVPDRRTFRGLVIPR